MNLKILHLGRDESGPDVYQELARLIGFYLSARSHNGEVTMVSDLRNALVLLVNEIDEQMEEREEGRDMLQ